MSSIWTPGGEHPVDRERSGGGPAGREPTREELEQAAAEYMAEIQGTPAHVIVGNHAVQLFELARIYLSADPPAFDDARLAIDAMGAVVEGLEGRLGEDEATLVEGLAQLRLAFVQMKKGLDASG